MANHRYWRIFAATNAGDAGYTQFAELEFRASAGGADTTAPGGTIFGSASPQAGTPAGAFANDGTTTFVQYGGTGGVYCGYDYGASSGGWKDIVEIAIMGALGAANRAPGEFRVEYSDDNVSWLMAWGVTYSSGYVTGTNVIFTKPSLVSAVRYWRSRMETSLGGGVFTFAEVKMMNTLGGASQCSGGVGFALSTYSGYSVANAFDANTTTNWASAAGSSSEYIGYDFGSGVTKNIIEMSWLPRQDSNFQQWPSIIYVEASADNIAWLPRWIVAKTRNTYSDGAFIVRDPAAVTSGATHRWWGIRPTTIQSGTVFGLREIEFRGTIGGADLTTGGIAGSYRPFADTTRPSYAFDSTTAEYGSASGEGLNDLIVYDYGHGNEKAVPAQIAMTARINGVTPDYNHAPTAFDLIYSDDGFNFTLQQSFTTPATWTSAEQRLFSVAGGGATRRRQLVN